MKTEIQLKCTFLVPIMSKAVIFLCAHKASLQIFELNIVMFSRFFLFVVNLCPLFIYLLFILYIFVFFDYLGELIDSMLQIVNSFLLPNFYF